MLDIVEYIYSNSGIANTIKRVMLKCKIYYLYNVYSMYRTRHSIDGMRKMEDSKRYFQSNKDRINLNLNSLSDEKSKQTYEKLLQLRQCYELKHIPPYNYFDQYYPKDVPEWIFEDDKDDWVYVDCGAFDGDTVELFAGKVNKYERIYAFEPDKRNVARIKERNINNLIVVEAVVSDYDGMAVFCKSEYGGGGKIKRAADEQTINVSSYKIDTVLAGKRCDFIKMDIEGAELLALQGAKETILKHKPRLAISIYHSDEDMVDIVEYIHELVPDYRLYIRAHTMGIAETILYAIV